MRLSGKLALACLLLALQACQTTVEPGGEAKGGKDDGDVFSKLTPSQKKNYINTLKKIEKNSGIVYSCKGGTTVVVVYGLDKSDEIVAAKVSVGNIVTPPILKTVEGGRNMFRFFDGKTEWSTSKVSGAKLAKSKDGKLVLKGNEKIVLSGCKVNAKLSSKFNKTMNEQRGSGKNDGKDKDESKDGSKDKKKGDKARDAKKIKNPGRRFREPVITLPVQPPPKKEIM